MIIPTRIEVTNFGSIRHTIIEPHPTGITALDGRTGSGKSTVLAALAWCLYGYIGGVDAFSRQAEVRSDHAPAGEPVKVQVTFSWGGKEFVVTRSLNRSKSGKESAQATMSVDGKPELNMSPDRVTERITAMTGLNGRSFVSSFFIPQQHLERLANATPAELQTLVEDQTGLGLFTRVIADAKSAARDKQLTADALPGSEVDVAAARAEVVAAQATLDQQQETHAQANEKHTTVTGWWQEASRKLALLRAAQQQAHDGQLQVARAETALDNARQNHADAVAAATAPNPGNVEQARNRHHAITAARNKVQVARQLWVSRRDGRAQVATQQQDTSRALAEFSWEGATNEADARNRAQAAQTALGDTTVEIGAGRHEIKQLEASLAVLEAADDSTRTCPTCTQPVPAMDTVRRTLTNRVRDIETRIGDRQQFADRAQRAMAGFTHQIDTWERLTAAAEQATARLSEADQALAEAVEQAKTATALLREMVGLDEQAKADECDRVAGELLDQLDTQIRAAEMWDAQQRQVKSTAERVTLAEQALDAATKQQVEAPTREAMEAATAEESRLATERSTANTDLSQASIALSVAEQELRQLVARRDDTEAVWNRKVEAVAEADVARHAVAVLTEQRRDLLTAYTAAVSSAATAVMEQAGGGRHIGVQLDETFVPQVILADGRTRPVRTCSGGEKLRAALCLCIGQMQQHSEAVGQTGMLFADEIATGYDADTTAAVMETIATLGVPMLLIGHNEQVRQIANRVYQFDNSDDTGTTVTLAGAQLGDVTSVPVNVETAPAA